MGQDCSIYACCQSEGPLEFPNQQSLIPQEIKIKRTTSIILDNEIIADVYVDSNDDQEKDIEQESIVENFQPNILQKQQEKTNGKFKIRRQSLFAEISMIQAEEAKVVEEKENINNIEIKQTWIDFYQFALLYQRIVHFYEFHDIDSACNLIPSLHQMESSIRSERNMTQQEFQTQLKTVSHQWSKQHENQDIRFLNRPLLRKMQELLEDMNHYTNLVDNAVFEERYNKHGIKFSLRNEQDSIGLLIETQLQTPFENMTVFFNKMEYALEFMPFCQKASQLKDCGRNSKIGHAVFDFPIISQRQAFFQTFAYNRLNSRDEVYLYFRTLHDKPQLQKELGVELHPNKKYVQITYKYFVVSYKPLREGVGHLKLAVNLDPGVSFLPDFILEPIIQQFGKKMFKKMLAISDNFKGSIWEKSIEEDSGIFYLAKQSIATYLQKKKKENASI